MPSLQNQTLAEIERNKRNKQRKKAPLDHTEITLKFGNDFARGIDVFAPDKPVIGLIVAPFEQALSGYSTRQTVSKPGIAGNDDNQIAFGGQKAPQFRKRSGQVRKVLKNMNRYHAIKALIGIIESFLTIANLGDHAGKALGNARGHIRSKFNTMVGLVDEIFVSQMLAQSGPDLQGTTALPTRRGLDGKPMIKPLDHAEAFRKHLVPIMHEVVANPHLLRRQRRKSFGPLRRWLRLDIHDEEV